MSADIASGQYPLVPADPWRRALSRHHHRRPRGQLQLSAPDRAGRRSARLFRRAAADRAQLRGFLGGGLGGGALDRAAALSGRGAARPAIAQRRRAHDRDARPGVERTAADQRRHRRRSRREQGRRHFPRPRRALRRDARVSQRLQRSARRQDRQCRRQAHPYRGRTPAVSAGAVAAPAALFRRIVGCRHRCRRRYASTNI